MSDSSPIPPRRAPSDAALSQAAGRADGGRRPLGLRRQAGSAGAGSRAAYGTADGAASGSAGARGGAAVFTVEQFRQGVTVGAGGPAQAAGSNAQVAGSDAGAAGGSSGSAAADGLAGSADDGRLAGSGGAAGSARTAEEARTAANGPAPDFGPGAFGRRYRPLGDGRMSDASLRTAELDEAQKLAQLKKIKDSAEEYEGFLMAEMIKSMRQTSFVKTPGGDTYSEIAEKPFTAALTAAGGLGLAETIVGQVAAQEGLGDVLATRPEALGPHWRQRLAPTMMPKPGPRAAFAPGEKPQAGSPRSGAPENG
ncbi:MAG: hypothetical protein LBU12_09145 [Deltaproteobacteria bacterium]|jgi:Rod binding domain-containing protein|nr:hypothetical protein [Deltaproteobacteria bacterium]